MGINDNNPHIGRLPLPGEVIDGRYRLTEAFASGGMGVIMRAEQLRTGRGVAVKLLHPHIAARDDFAARFMREVQVATMFDHPHIVRVYDVGETDNGSLYLVMELLDGEELKDIISREAPLSTDRLFNLGLQMIDGLAEAHSHDVVHRDFKPSNVFVGTSRRGKEIVKLLDFGIAKLLNSGETQVTATGQFTGTPSYMAPETMVDSSAKTNKKAADIYAAGLVFLEMLTGQRVFDGNGIAQTLLKHLKKPVPIPEPLVHTPLGNVIRRATSKHPDDRYVDADALYAALEAAQQGTPNLTLTEAQIPDPVGTTSPSLLEELAKQEKSTSLDMLRKAPQHTAVSNQGTPPSLPSLPSLPELPDNTRFGNEPTTMLGAETTDTDDGPPTTSHDTEEPPPTREMLPAIDELPEEFEGNPTEIFATDPNADFSAEPTRAARPSRLPQPEKSRQPLDTNDNSNQPPSDTGSSRNIKPDDAPQGDFDAGPTKAQIPSQFPEPPGYKKTASTSNSGTTPAQNQFSSGASKVPNALPTTPPSSKYTKPSPAPDVGPTSPERDLTPPPPNHGSSQSTEISRDETPPGIATSSSPSSTDTSSPQPSNQFGANRALEQPSASTLQKVRRDPQKLAILGASLFAVVVIAIAVPLLFFDDDPESNAEILAATDDPSTAQPIEDADGDDELDEVAHAESEEDTTVRVQVASDPSGATLWNEGEVVGETDFVAEFEHRELPREIRLEMEGYEDAVLQLTDDDTDHFVALQELPEPQPEPVVREPSPEPPPEPPPEQPPEQPPSSPSEPPSAPPDEPQEVVESDEDDEEEDTGSSVDHMLDRHLNF